MYVVMEFRSMYAPPVFWLFRSIAWKTSLKVIPLDFSKNGSMAIS